jgi:8-amino-7-oxononanoate synthase
MNEEFLQNKITQRKEQNAYRQLRAGINGIDFCSNDYLGVVKNNLLHQSINEYKSGSTGSRLLTGNYKLTEETETMIADFHGAQTALIFNSGYDANTGILSAVPQRGDTVLYDYLSHASIRDGLRLSLATSYSFLHNDIIDLEKKLAVAKGNIFVVTESVFSMDGDTAPLKEIVLLCQQFKAHLIVDEAHATGVVGDKGEGLVQVLQLEQHCFARVNTFGKALGCHGAVILGSNTLREYLINFCRAFIYTTALPPVSIAAIKTVYQIFPQLGNERNRLEKLVAIFQSANTKFKKLKSNTPVQSVIIQGNEEVKAIAALCAQNNFDVRAILYPTVPKESERLRIVLHSFNTEAELNKLIQILDLTPASSKPKA